MSEISVIIPVFQVEAYLRRCLDSLLGQSFQDFEVLLVDDGSTDASGSICDEYGECDARFHVFHRDNRGQSAARNFALDWLAENSHSPWITFIDSDDWVHPQYLEELLLAAKDSGLQISICNCKKVSGPQPSSVLSPVWTQMCAEEVCFGIASHSIRMEIWGKLYDAALFRSLRFPDGKLWEDVSTIYQLILDVGSCAVTSEAMYYYFQNPNGTVLKHWTPKRLDEFDAYEKQLEFFSQEPRWDAIYRALQNSYIKAISYSYYMEQHSELPADEKARYAGLLQRKMRTALSKYKKTAGIRFRDDRGVYETAYPRRMRLYWMLFAQLNKLRRQK